MSEQFRQELAGRWYPSSAARAVAQRYVRDLPPSVDRSDVAAIAACAIDDARKSIDVAAAKAAAFEEAAERVKELHAQSNDKDHRHALSVVYELLSALAAKERKT